MLYCVWYDAVFVKMMLVVIRITLKLDLHIERMFVKMGKHLVNHNYWLRRPIIKLKSCRIPFVIQIIGTNTQFRMTWILAVRGCRACIHMTKTTA